MDDATEFQAELFHDGVVKQVSLPTPEQGEPPPHVRVPAVDAAGNAVVDVFLLSDASGWPARAGYRYAGSMPLRPSSGTTP
jgi:hypothetical protein